jgi:hypothetical protein
MRKNQIKTEMIGKDHETGRVKGKAPRIYKGNVLTEAAKKVNSVINEVKETPSRVSS